MGRLFWKFFLAFCLAQLTAIVGLSITFWLEHHNQDPTQQSIAHSPPAETAVHAAALTLQAGGREALRRFVAETGKEHLPLVYASDEQGHDLLGRPLSSELFREARAAAGADGPHQAVRSVVSADGQRFWLFALSNGHERHPPGLGGRPPPPHRHGLLPWEPLIAGSVASLIFSALLAWHFAQPIRLLRQSCEAVAQGDLAGRPSASMQRRRDELADLARDFERMTGRIKQLMDGQRRLLHDVSHELRSPLARLQLAIDLARQQPHKSMASMQRIEREAGRMEKLLGEVLTLSRLEAEVEPGRTEAIDLAELVDDVLEDARFEADAHQQQLVFEPAGLLPVIGNVSLLHRALENVLRNALRYSPDGSVVTVQTALEDGLVRVRVLDQGPGVVEQELEAIFEAFHRGESANRHGKGADGHGLGLAIARRALKSQGGGISARNRPEGGLCVEMWLPVVR